MTDKTKTICPLIFDLGGIKREERGQNYFTIIIFYFAHKIYEASDYNKNKHIFLSECDFKERADQIF